jgi:Beta-lactamase
MANIQGFYDELFAAVPTTLAGLLDQGDSGGSAAVYVDGEPVVDVWGGYADADRTIAWQRDTITNVWSVTINPRFPVTEDGGLGRERRNRSVAVAFLFLILAARPP